jgi:hypothetical protein
MNQIVNPRLMCATRIARLAAERFIISADSVAVPVKPTRPVLNSAWKVDPSTGRLACVSEQSRS